MNLMETQAMRVLLCLLLIPSMMLCSRADEVVTERASPVPEAAVSEILTLLSDSEKAKQVSWELVFKEKASASLADFNFSPNGEGIVFANTDGNIKAWQVSSGELLGEFDVKGKGLKVALAPDGKHALVGGDFSHVQAWHLESKKMVFKHNAYRGSVHDLFVSSDGEYMIGTDTTGWLRWYPILGGMGYSLPLDTTDEEAPVAFAVSHDGIQLLSTEKSGSTKHLMLPSGTQKRPRLRNFALLNDAERTAFGETTYAASTGQRVKFLYPAGEAGQQMGIAERQISLTDIKQLVISSDEQLLGAITSHGQVHVMDPRRPAISFVSAPPLKGPVTGLGVSRLGPDCRTVAVHHNSYLMVWKVVSDPLSRKSRMQDVVGQLLEAEQFAELSSLTEKVCDQNEDLFIELVNQLWPATAPGQIEKREKQLQAWHAAIPKDLLPRLLLARFESSRAWSIRGSGFANSVSEEDWEGFTKHIDLAASYLDGFEPNETTPSEFYFTRISLHTDQGSEFKEFERTTEQLLKFRPKYTAAHEQAVRHLMPRWHGEPGESAFYAAKVSQRLGGEEGKKMYVHLAESLLPYHHTEEYYAATEFDYKVILEYLNLQVEQDLTTAERDHIHGALMRFSRRKGDAETAQKTFARIVVDGWMARNRSDPRAFNDVMRTVMWLQSDENKDASANKKAFGNMLQGLLPSMPKSSKKRKADPKASEKAPSKESSD